MAHTGRFKITHGDMFPHGAYLVSEVEPVRDFDKSSAGAPVQAVDKESGLPVWAVSVLDADPDARKERQDGDGEDRSPSTSRSRPKHRRGCRSARSSSTGSRSPRTWTTSAGGSPTAIRATGMRAPLQRCPARTPPGGGWRLTSGEAA